MNTRTILYGYEIRNGQKVICQSEAKTVRCIFKAYLGGLSYQKIAVTLNEQQIPYGESVSLWNKNKIKRMLEDNRYIGENGWPAILEKQDFQSVQDIIRNKNTVPERKNAKPEDVINLLRLHRYFRCETCGKLLYANGSGEQYREYIYLRCRECGITHGFPRNALTEEIERQIKARDEAEQEIYRPSGEVMRLTNAINRSLEHPDHPDETTDLILQAVSARYGCCPAPDHIKRTSLTDFTPKQFKSLITHITISKNSVITVHFRS